MSKTKATPKAPTFTYSCPKGTTHVDAIRALLAKGHSTSEVKDAYVLARLPEFKKRPAHADKDDDTLRSFVRKHADTHIKLARVDMDPAVQAERADKVRRSLANAEARVTALREKAKALPARSA